MTDEKLKERIFELIKKRGKIKKSEISKSIQREAEGIQNAINELMIEGKISSFQSDSTGGRSAMWFALKEVAELAERDLMAEQQERAAISEETQWENNKRRISNYIKDFGPISNTQLYQRFPNIKGRQGIAMELEKQGLIWSMLQRNGERGSPATVYGWHEHTKPEEMKASEGQSGWIATRIWFYIRCPGTALPQMHNILTRNGYEIVLDLVRHDALGKHDQPEIEKEMDKIANSKEYYEIFGKWLYNQIRSNGQPVFPEDISMLEEHGRKAGFIQ